MNQLVTIDLASPPFAALTVAGLGTVALPPIVTRADAPTGRRYVEFFTARLRNRNTREAYARAATSFLA